MPRTSFRDEPEFYHEYREARPGVVVSEVLLRGMSGIELADKLASEKKDVLVTLLMLARMPRQLPNRCNPTCQTSF